uniref:Uncharacterized protein n=1 Tax=Kryptolebias marmoratus TaxID=37003 RepID=A0A3Q3B0V4_KRYMA
MLLCFLKNKHFFLGNIPHTHCKTVFVPCTLYANNDSLNSSQAPPQTTCSPYYHVPDVLGTLPQIDLYWLCSYFLYLALPENWAGRCAPIIATEHSYVVSAVKVTNQNRRVPRSVTVPHDSVWGSNVPENKKLWPRDQKVILSLFPSLGVGKLMLRVETLNYQFESFVDNVLTALVDVKPELTALILMTLQNRMVLDQLMALTGGVCVLVGTACCTFIPANDEDGGAIALALSNLTALRDTLAADHASPSTLFSWLPGNGWRQLLIKFLTPVIIVLMLLMALICCVIPLVKRLILNLINVHLLRYTFLTDSPSAHITNPTYQSDDSDSFDF